jgi:uncharacterized protein YukE
MPDHSDTSPPPGRAPGPAPEPSGKPAPGGSGSPKPKHRHRAIVWPLVVLASVVLIFSMIANWVQTEVLDTNQVKDTTDQIVKDPDVQQALATFTVDQLYANVDVQGEIKKKLPSAAQPLALPVSAAVRQLATNAAERALASPQVQNLVSTAVAGAQQQFVSLIENKDAYVSTTGGNVTLEYGSVVADLAARLGVDPATISKIQGLVKEYSTDLRQSLTTAQARISSVQSTLSELQGGQLSPTLKQNLQDLHQNATELQAKIAGLETTIKEIKGKVPDQLKGRLSALQGRLSHADSRVTALKRRTAAVLADPSTANVTALDDSLASAQSRIKTVLNRQAVQTPGELVLMSSGQLSGLQSLVSLLRNLGFVLPVLALLLYLGALYLAKGWRREALIAAGGGILVAAVFILLLRRLIGNGVDSVAASDTVKPAITSVWDILSAGLRQRALFVLVIGLAFIGGGALAGPGRHEVAVRRFLAPYLRDHPVGVYAVVAVLFLLWLSFIPGINNVGQVLVIVVLAALAVVGIEILRRQAAREFPPGASGS